MQSYKKFIKDSALDRISIYIKTHLPADSLFNFRLRKVRVIRRQSGRPLSGTI